MEKADEVTWCYQRILKLPAVAKSIWTGANHGAAQKALEADLGASVAATVVRRVDAHLAARCLGALVDVFQAYADGSSLSVKGVLIAINSIDGIVLGDEADCVVQCALGHCAMHFLCHGKDMEKRYGEALKVIGKRERYEEHADVTEMRASIVPLLKKCAHASKKGFNHMIAEAEEWERKHPMASLIEELRSVAARMAAEAQVDAQVTKSRKRPASASRAERTQPPAKRRTRQRQAPNGDPATAPKRVEETAEATMQDEDEEEVHVPDEEEEVRDNTQQVEVSEEEEESEVEEEDDDNKGNKHDVAMVVNSEDDDFVPNGARPARTARAVRTPVRKGTRRTARHSTPARYRDADDHEIDAMMEDGRDDNEGEEAERPRRRKSTRRVPEHTPNQTPQRRHLRDSDYEADTVRRSSRKRTNAINSSPRKAASRKTPSRSPPPSAGRKKAPSKSPPSSAKRKKTPTPRRNDVVEEEEEEEDDEDQPQERRAPLRNSGRKAADNLTQASKELSEAVVDPLPEAMKHARTARRKMQYDGTPEGREATPIEDSEEEEEEEDDDTSSKRGLQPVEAAAAAAYEYTDDDHFEVVTGQVQIRGAWSHEEDETLIKGLREFGWSEWGRIHAKYWLNAKRTRSKFQIKDRARHLHNTRRINRNHYPPDVSMKRPGKPSKVKPRVKLTPGSASRRSARHIAGKRRAHPASDDDIDRDEEEDRIAEEDQGDEVEVVEEGNGDPDGEAEAQPEVDNDLEEES